MNESNIVAEKLRSLAEQSDEVDRKRERRRQRRQRKVCFRCGYKRRPGHTQCANCLTRNNSIMRRQYHNRIKAGICPTCNDPHPGPFKQCETCLERARMWRKLREIRNEVA